MNRDTLHAYAMGMLSAGAEPTREDLAAFAANVECDDNGDARELGDEIYRDSRIAFKRVSPIIA